MIIIAATCNVSYCLSQNQARPTASDNIPKAYTHSVDSLSWYIDVHFDTDKQKAEAIYVWITNNLTYNVYTTFTSRNEVYSENVTCNVHCKAGKVFANSLHCFSAH